MASFEQIELLMQGLGPVLEPLAIDFAEEGRIWGIEMEEDLAVIVQFDEQKNCLVLSCELGSPPEGDRTALYEMLMQLNYHWDVTGGTRMAIDCPRGNIVQLFETGADGLDIQKLSTLVAAFSSTAEIWRRIIQSPPSSQSTLQDFGSGSDLRV